MRSLPLLVYPTSDAAFVEAVSTLQFPRALSSHHWTEANCTVIAMVLLQNSHIIRLQKNVELSRLALQEHFRCASDNWMASIRSLLKCPHLARCCPVIELDGAHDGHQNAEGVG